MALTKIPRGLLDTGIADSSDATAITIDSSENVTTAAALATGGNLTVNGNTNLIGNLTVDSTTLYVDSSNNRVGIGITSPEYPLEVNGSNVSSGGGLATFGIFDTGTAYNGTNPGGGIAFRGKYNNGGSLTNFATVQGIKENTTDGNYASAVRFTTRANGGNLTEAMRITSGQDLGVGTSNPLLKVTAVDSGVGGTSTSGNVGVTHGNGSIPIGAHNENNSATYSAIALETRTSGASRWLMANEWTSTYLGDLVFHRRTGGTASAEAFRIDASGNVGINTGASPRVYTASFGSSDNVKHLTVESASGSVLELVGSSNSNGVGMGAIQFVNDANDNNAANAGGKELALIMAQTETSDTNTSSDSGGVIRIFTKPEAGTTVERMRIDSDGIITTPYLPRFVAFLAASTAYNSGVNQLNGTGWTVVHTNNGSHFSTSTGKFTAPVAGFYQFTINLCTSSAAPATTYWSAEMYTQASGGSAVRVLGGWNEHTAGYQRTEATYTRYLTAGTTVWPGMENATNITLLGHSSGVYSRFEGYLIG